MAKDPRSSLKNISKNPQDNSIINDSPNKKRGYSLAIGQKEQLKKNSTLGAEAFNTSIDASRDVRSPQMGVANIGSAAIL